MNARSPSDESAEQSGGLIWLPYVAPMFTFLLLVEASRRVPEHYSLWMLVLRVLIPLGLLVYFAIRGNYSELRFRISMMTSADVALGVALAALWIAPYMLFPSLRPDESESFDPALAGAAIVPLVLSLRAIGYAIVTPLMEELFMRSFLMRMAIVFDTDEDFREQPIGQFTWRSFLVVVIVFLATHVMWEWWVMLPWAVLTNLWFYYRKELFALVVVHGVTNGSILLAAILSPTPIWFFV